MKVNSPFARKPSNISSLIYIQNKAYHFKKCRKWTVPEQVSLETLPPSIRWRNPTRLISQLLPNCTVIYCSKQKSLGLSLLTLSTRAHTSNLTKVKPKVAEDCVLTGVFDSPADRIRVPANRRRDRKIKAKKERESVRVWWLRKWFTPFVFFVNSFVCVGVNCSMPIQFNTKWAFRKWLWSDGYEVWTQWNLTRGFLQFGRRKYLPFNVCHRLSWMLTVTGFLITVRFWNET